VQDVGFASQHSLGWHVLVEHVLSPGESFRWFVPSVHPPNPVHVGFVSQQSDTVQVLVAQLPVRTALR